MNSFFQKLTNFLESEVVPIANRLDEEEELYREVYTRFIQHGSLNLLTPKNLGGLGGERKEWIEYNILMAQYSGALLFLQAQHQFSISRLKMLLPYPKVEETLRLLASEGKGIGLTLQKSKTLLQVQETSEGYRLSGKLPWVTGYGYFPQLLFSFECDETLFYTLLPFQERQEQQGSLLISQKIETAVFNSVPSHSVILDNWLIHKNDILASHEVRAKAVIEHPSVYNFAGVSKALLALTLQSSYRDSQEVRVRHEKLSKAWEDYYQNILEEKMPPRALRAEGLALAEQCAFLARIACGSAGILKSHPLNRLIREIWQYTVAGYSEEQLKAYLEYIR